MANDNEDVSESMRLHYISVGKYVLIPALNDCGMKQRQSWPVHHFTRLSHYNSNVDDRGDESIPEWRLEKTLQESSLKDDPLAKST